MVLGSSLSAVYDSLLVPGLAASSYWKAGLFLLESRKDER